MIKNKKISNKIDPLLIYSASLLSFGFAIFSFTGKISLEIFGKYKLLFQIPIYTVSIFFISLGFLFLKKAKKEKFMNLLFLISFLFVILLLILAMMGL